MKNQNKILLLLLIGMLASLGLKAQHRPVDELNKTDRFGFTTMFYYTYRQWTEGSRETKGSLRFDSFRIWAQTDVDKKFFGAVQYRFYEGWRTPTYLYVGYHVNDNNTIQLGQTWVPFGFGYQPFDDWGNIAFYVGLQDDYDYGFTWNGNYGIFSIHAGFFKNQQLSASMSTRYDTDIYSGNVNDGDIILVPKHNREVNQINARFSVKPSGEKWSTEFGVSGMAGQIYNETSDLNGTRYAAAVHASVNTGFFHYNIQATWYQYTQALPDTATQDMQDFINMSSWNFAYEIPGSANILTSSVAFDIIGEKLTVHANYSYLWGGTSQASSQLLTFGVRALWESFEIFGEAYYGVNDPQLSGNASGYGRNAESYDFRFDIRFFYKLNIVSENTIEKFIDKRNKKAQKKE